MVASGRTGVRGLRFTGASVAHCCAMPRPPQRRPPHPDHSPHNALAAPLQGLGPVVAPGARLLVLGSFPGVASLRAQQYYAHPRNQFWPIVSTLLGLQGDEALHARPYAERVQVAQAAGLAIWDVYGACEREGSLDSAIRAAELNDLTGLIRQVPSLRLIAHNGGESARHRRLTEALGLPVMALPSTSPANASWGFERKLAVWREAFEQAGLAVKG